MSHETVLFAVDEFGVATLTLNRPAFYNSFNHQLCLETTLCLKEIQQRNDIKALILTGTGKALSAGGDINWLVEADTNLKKNYIVDSAVSMIKQLHEMKIPIICAVNGVAAGAGISLVLVSDIVIASNKARFAPNFVNRALVPDTAASYFLVRKVGVSKALDLFWTGRILNAEEAQALGIFHRVVPDEQLMAEAHTVAKSLTCGPYQTLLMIKDLVKSAVNNDFDAQCSMENYYQLLAWSQPEFIAGINAFIAGKQEKS